MERNNSTQPVQDIINDQEKGNLGARAVYLCLQIKGEHGKAEVEHEVLGLEALQGTPHPECHHGLALDEDQGTDDIKGAHQQDQHKTGLRDRQDSLGHSRDRIQLETLTGATKSAHRLLLSFLLEQNHLSRWGMEYSQCWTCRAPRNTGLCLSLLELTLHFSCFKDGPSGKRPFRTDRKMFITRNDSGSGSRVTLIQIRVVKKPLIILFTFIAGFTLKFLFNI